MAETKWTLGPWSVPHFARKDIKCDCGYVLVETCMGAVATVTGSCGQDWETHGDNPPIEQCIANAHLIAAAPDFAAGFEQMQAHEQAGGDGWWKGYELLKAAYAKARGEGA